MWSLLQTLLKRRLWNSLKEVSQVCMITRSEVSGTEIDLYQAGMIKGLQVIERDRSQNRTLLSTVKIVVAEFVQHPPERSLQQRKYLHGLLLFLLDKFCMRIVKHAKITAEWDTVMQDVIEVGRFTGATLQKEEAIHRLRKYRCTHA